MPAEYARTPALAWRVYAWSGAAAFAASIAYFAYAYLVVMGRPASDAQGTPRAAVFTDIALFAVFGLHHSVMARPFAKRWLARVVPPPLERATYVWLASVLFFSTCYFWQPPGGVLYDHGGPVAWAHYGIQATGLALVWRSVARLDALELAGIRQLRGETATRAFQTSGPYRLVRHPLYLGWILLACGAARMTMAQFLFAGISLAYLLLAIPWEERSLHEKFGEPYREYAGRVRWRLVPYLY